MWSEIAIPDETDLPKELENAGLKTMEVFEKKLVSDVSVFPMALNMNKRLICFMIRQNQRDPRPETNASRLQILI
jgi:hypothetical protein